MHKKSLNVNVIFKPIFFGLCLIFTSVFNAQELNFKEVSIDFPRQEKNLRKWDNPVVADLDQDGYNDLLINNHGFGIQVQWNNKGKFAKPYDIIMGDLHGISVGDIDNDGHLEVIMSRGGGSGSNARNSKIYKVKGREFIPMTDFKEPLALMRGRTVKFTDLDNDGDLDLLNFAFPDKSKQGESENYIYQNNGKGELILHATLPASQVDGQKTLITDFNNDNRLDLILYGHGNIKAFQNQGNLKFKEVTEQRFPFPITNVTNIAEIDFDNDGDLDLYITRGKEFEKGETFYNIDTKTFGFFTKRGEFQFQDLEIGDVIHLENFQSQWPNNDTYFIGESSYDYVFEGETHSGKNIRLVNSDALGFPDNANYKDKKGWYIGYVGNQKWRIAGFLWAPATGIVQNVKNYVEEGNHPEGLQDMLLENRGNNFIDISKALELSLKEHTTAVTIADFDNNGFEDLLIIRRGNLVNPNESLIYLNQGNSWFKSVQDHHIILPELGAIGMAVETLDYNQDGKVDVVIGNERGKWHLFKNQSSKSTKNNYITANVGRSPKENTSALGAKVVISACGTMQTQRVGSSSAQYSLSHNTYLHFGLGKCKSADVKVVWSNGESDTKTTAITNKTIKIGK